MVRKRKKEEEARNEKGKWMKIRTRKRYEKRKIYR